jgi:hypothetical protein
MPGPDLSYAIPIPDENAGVRPNESGVLGVVGQYIDQTRRFASHGCELRISGQEEAAAAMADQFGQGTHRAGQDEAART